MVAEFRQGTRKYNPETGKRIEFDAVEQDQKKRAAVVAEIQALDRQQRALEARQHFMPFILFTSPDPEYPNDPTKSRYKNAAHHDAIARHLEQLVRGDFTFLILVMPPRHGKSEQVSRKLPAWYSGLFPAHDIVVATYNDDFAADFGAEVRAIMSTPQYHQVFPNFRLRRGGAAKDRLQTEEGGLLSFVGRGGSLTGRGAHLLICDDLIKDDKEAMSQAIRDSAWNWLVKVAMTRRRGKKLVILTTTRWHVDDPIGRLTNSNTDENPYYNERLAKRIKIINLPAIAEDDDPMGRQPGEALWPDGPDNFDLDFLEEQRAFLGPLGFAALYQGRPTLEDGSLFKRENIQFYNPAELPKDLRIYCASDHAVALGQRNDFTVLLKIGVDTLNNMYVLDCFWKKAPSDQVVEAMLTMADGERKPIIWWAERGHISKSIGPFLHKRMIETTRWINMVEMPAVADKPTRAQSIIARVALGKLFLPAWAGWTHRAIEQMLAFPNGTHDDFVDCLSLFGLGLQNQWGPQKVAAKRKDPVYGTLAHLKQNDRWLAEQRQAAGGF